MHSNSRFLRRTVTATLALTVACSSATDPSGDGGRPATLDALPRSLSASERKLVDAGNDFSFSLFRRLSTAQRDSNVFTSPLSASLALGMTMNGAAGNTYSEMRGALAFGAASETEINEGYKSLMALLRGLDPTVDVRIANSIWYRTGFPVNQSFLDAGRTWFGAEVSALDFASPTAVGTINAWVSTATAAKIPTIIEEIRQEQVMFLINAIYFKGSWRDRFDPARTTDGTFRGVAGSQPMKLMHRNGSMRVLHTPDFAAVDLPYGNSAFTMTAILPNEGRSVETIAASLPAASWSGFVGEFREGTADLYFPRFKLEWQRTLNDDLEALGMRDAFREGGADFTRLSTARGRELYISIVKQKTFVDVNEEGTEAAAVTNVGISVTSAPAPIRFDRPFLFVIRERLSGTVMFMGKIVKMP